MQQTQNAEGFPSPPLTHSTHVMVKGCTTALLLRKLWSRDQKSEHELALESAEFSSKQRFAWKFTGSDSSANGLWCCATPLFFTGTAIAEDTP